MTFSDSGYLFLLLLVIPYVIWYFLSRKKEPSMTVPDTGAYENIAPSLRQYFVHIPFFFFFLCFVMAVLVLARPQTSNYSHDS